MRKKIRFLSCLAIFNIYWFVLNSNPNIVLSATFQREQIKLEEKKKTKENMQMQIYYKENICQ